MNEMSALEVKVFDEKLVVDSRAVAQNFGKRHDNVLRDIENLKRDVLNFEEMFFESTMPDTYGREQTVYLMNRDGFSLLAMGFTGREAMAWKVKYISAFNEMEKLWNSPEQIMSRALKVADQTIGKLQTEKRMLIEDVDRMKPKEIFADAVAASKSSILIGELAKILRQNGIDTGEKRLFHWMRQQGYLIRRSGTDYNMPTQRSMEMGLFEVKETVITHAAGHTTISKTTKVTGKGQQYFINKFMG